ncbi:hypothetical protein B0H16DRAFT_1219282, partial [Mycena metata]
STSSSGTTSASATSASQPTSTSTTTTTTTSDSSSTTSSSPTSSPVSTPSAPTTPAAPSTPASLTTSAALSTGTDGNVVTVDLTLTVSQPASSSAAPSSSATSAPSTGSGGTLSQGGIIGLSVAGGVAAIFLTAFLIWKFTRKSGTDFDDGENIKWPELNAHGGGSDSHAMPVTNTGRAGFGAGFESESDLSRAPSQANNYAASSADLHSEDPYSVPPLPHNNPSAPYRDDPSAVGGAYYDPYRGPVPQTFNEAVHGAPPPEWGAQNEAIPMTQMGRASPGPGMMYDGARTGSPAPYTQGGARVPSPGPGAAYNVGRASPGPGAVYGGGRASPGPQMSY